MFVENRLAIEKFLRKHPIGRNSFLGWIQKAEAENWRNFTELKETFNSADYRKPFVIFNVGGNKYRILAKVIYQESEVHVIKVGTHEDYNSWKL